MADPEAPPAEAAPAEGTPAVEPDADATPADGEETPATEGEAVKPTEVVPAETAEPAAASGDGETAAADDGGEADGGGEAAVTTEAAATDGAEATAEATDAGEGEGELKSDGGSAAGEGESKPAEVTDGAPSEAKAEGGDDDLAAIDDPLAGEDRGALEAAAATSSGDGDAATAAAAEAPTADDDAPTTDGGDGGEADAGSGTAEAPAVAIPTDGTAPDGSQSPAPTTADEGTATSPEPLLDEPPAPTAEDTPPEPEPEPTPAPAPAPSQPLAAARPSSRGQSRGKAPASKVIHVVVNHDDGSQTQVPVTIDFPTVRKPFLGGYRNAKNGKEYHHVSAQTYTRVRKATGKPKSHRDTQTKQVSSGTTNQQMTTSHTSTQMSAAGVFVDPIGDKEITPRSYETAEVWHGKRVAAVIVLQSHLRRVVATKRVQALRDQKRRVEEWRVVEEERKVDEEEAEWQRRVDRRVNPRTKADFNLLYRGLELWRVEELTKIRSLGQEDQTPAKVALLQQQCTYLGAIDKLRIDADRVNREKRIEKFFNETSAPREWVEEEYGKVNQMETLGTLRSRELREVYHALGLTSFDLDERLDILLHVKLVVQEYDSKLTREIVGLLNREADLLLRGTKKANLTGLQKRIRNLFLQFCEEPEYNPMSERYLSKHRDKDAYKDNIVYCSSCLKYKDAGEFAVSSTDDTVGKCSKCLGVTNIATKRSDTTQHRRMMEAVQRAEIDRGYKSQVVFMMSLEDVVYLVDTIWRGQSALSQESELFRLTLCRWDRSEEFSPWNAILLTADEAATHEQLQDGGLESYGPAFIRLAHQKHLLAKSYFYDLVAAQAHPVAGAADAGATFVDAQGAQIVRTGA